MLASLPLGGSLESGRRQVLSATWPSFKRTITLPSSSPGGKETWLLEFGFTPFDLVVGWLHWKVVNRVKKSLLWSQNDPFGIFRQYSVIQKRPGHVTLCNLCVKVKVVLVIVINSLFCWCSLFTEDDEGPTCVQPPGIEIGTPIRTIIVNTVIIVTIFIIIIVVIVFINTIIATCVQSLLSSVLVLTM